jgi:hypothetical protein
MSGYAHVGNGSIASFRRGVNHFRSTPISRRFLIPSACLKGATNGLMHRSNQRTAHFVGNAMACLAATFSRAHTRPHSRVFDVSAFQPCPLVRNVGCVRSCPMRANVLTPDRLKSFSRRLSDLLMGGALTGSNDKLRRERAPGVNGILRCIRSYYFRRLLMHSYGDHLILACGQPSVRRNGPLEVVVFLAGNEAEVFQRRQ